METELRFHHIGIACHDIEATKPFYIAQGYAASETVVDRLQDIYICFLDKPDMPRLELLAPVDDKSPVNRTLAASGVTPYHICYSVSDIDAAAKELRGMRFVRVSKPTPACAMGNRLVCFLFKKEVGLIELVEE